MVLMLIGVQNVRLVLIEEIGNRGDNTLLIRAMDK